MREPIEPMTTEEFHRLRGKLGLSVYALAPRLGVSLRALQRYAAGERRIPEPVAKLLRLLASTARD